jgi:outer membrane protein OmpA-like peptidoglycan-associated protein
MRTPLRLAGLLVPVLALVFGGACARRSRPQGRRRFHSGARPPPAPQVSPTVPPPPAAVAPAPSTPVVAAAPAPPPAVPQEIAPNTALRPVHFDFDKSNIRPGDENILAANAGWLRDNRGRLLLIEGHADDPGDG